MKNKLLDQFNSLTNDEQEIVLALAVVLVPIWQNNLAKLLKDSACVSTSTVNKITAGLKTKLINMGLIQVTSDGWRCHEAVADELMKLAVNKEVFFHKLATQLLEQPNAYLNLPYRLSALNYLKSLRIYMYQGKVDEFIETLNKIVYYHPDQIDKIFARLFFKDFNETWFSQLNEGIRFAALKYYLSLNQEKLVDCSLQYQLLEKYFFNLASTMVRHTLIEYRLLRGNFENIEQWLLTEEPSANRLKLLGAFYFLQNRNQEAIEHFEQSLDWIKKETRKRNVDIGGLYGQFYHLALLKSRTPPHLALLKKQLEIAIKINSQQFLYTDLRLLDVVAVYQGQKSVDKTSYLPAKYTSKINVAYNHLFQALFLYWSDGIPQQLKADNKFLITLADFCKQAHQFGYKWYAVVSSLLLERVNYADKDCLQIAAFYKGSPLADIIDLLPRVENWERALNALAQLSESKTNLPADIVQTSRLIWLFSLTDGEYSLLPREQKIGKNGRWTKGKVVALKRLKEDLADFDYLSEQDLKICVCIEEEQDDYHRYWSKTEYVLADKALLAAVGHPHVYWADRDDYTSPVEMKIAQPQLLVKEKGENFHISLQPQIKNDAPVVIERTANDGILIYQINKQHQQVVQILGPQGLTVPGKARQQVIDSISSIASTLTVQSDIGGQSVHAETVEADSRLHIHLQPINDGLQIEIFVQPFVDGGPIYKPGVGGTTVLAEIEGKQLQTTRDFKLEKAYLKQTLAACPQLYTSKTQNWLMDDTEMALEALLQLQALPDFALLEWPKGRKIKISSEIDLAQVRFSIRKERDWFSVEGEVQIAEDDVLQMQKLIHLLKNSRGRFLKLENDQVIALTQELRQRLDDFAGLGDAHGDKVRFHPLAAQALEEITEGMAVKAEKQWKEQIARLTEMQTLVPALPSTFQGELRDYQIEGYQWLCRLAHWGAGACLADDMGLGKTIQALALILSRASTGPTLILAPTSVCMNWLEESSRFTPTLNVQQFGSGDRQQMLDNAGAFDLIVCSYGLLQSEGERLAAKKWHTLVADEAQAIKNALTKRSKAIMALEADFKIITTGTPIENHLGELWNLFNFINPGLLGSLQKFNQHYANAIENNQDHGVQLRLKKLLRPFILRRLKTDVLTELPARTEVTLHIELSREEQTFYEALRRDAVQTMQDMKNEIVPTGQQHLKVLAEIMKLRRACCHPRLVMEESTLSSAKLEAFEELVDELISNRHKALVFSQFIGHLSLIRELLDKKGIVYQYLDGSTPTPKRTQAVNAFQAGEGDLFLISLKAGGSGLNLTAADYVIHMDPWWNPAVEDQASDRAHRMGQKRPVTIYRLVAKGTIEDKIVDLHRHKRDLANNLLEGGELSGKMSVDEMLALIKDVD
jgi:SNF2 family DNA or RNA helicase